MKKIINGKTYNTETAQKVGYWYNSYSYVDFNYCEETLYQKRTGEFFLHGVSGANGAYAKSVGNARCSGANIVPLTESKAKKWAETHLDADEYIAIFGEPEE